MKKLSRARLATFAHWRSCAARAPNPVPARMSLVVARAGPCARARWPASIESRQGDTRARRPRLAEVAGALPPPQVWRSSGGQLAGRKCVQMGARTGPWRLSLMEKECKLLFGRPSVHQNVGASGSGSGSGKCGRAD